MLFNFFSAFLAISPLAFASPASSKHSSGDVLFESSVREKLVGPPTGWAKDESIKLNKNSMMNLRIHLVHQDMSGFHELALNIATPGHKLYGSHLSQEVIDTMIAPKDESKELVMQWLNREGLGGHAVLSPRADSVIVQASISQIESLINANYSAFIRTEPQQSVVRTLEYSIPDVLKSHVDMIQPTTFFGFRPQRSGVQISDARTGDQGADESEEVTGCTARGSITPTCLSNLYKFNSTINYTNGLMGVAGFLEEYPSKDDLSTFMASYSRHNKAETFTCLELNHNDNATCGNSGFTFLGAQTDAGEANLDVQYARAITQSIPNIYYSTYGSPPWLGGDIAENTNEPYLEFLNYLLSLNDSSLPNTISISYGDDESTVPLDYANNVCNLFSQLGARGVSVLVASGDSGVGGICPAGGPAKFSSAFPAGCPWVTTVGGTQYVPEVVWDRVGAGSGGGFSEVFGRPSYQNATVNKWLSAHNSTASFNSSGRAYPDVSAQAFGYQVVIKGLVKSLQGTSCATPAFASVIQLLNSDRLANGKTGLGFLNPWLYGNALSGLNDITTGSNSGCNGAVIGFTAVAGWDPATGLGTPNFETLLKVSRAT